MEVRCPQAPLSRQGGSVGGQLGGELGELGRRGGRPAGGGLLGGGVQLGGDRLGALGGEREVRARSSASVTAAASARWTARRFQSGACS